MVAHVHRFVKLQVFDGFADPRLDLDQLIQPLRVVLARESETVLGFVLGDELLDDFVHVADSRDFKQFFQSILEVGDFLLNLVCVKGHICQGIRCQRALGGLGETLLGARELALLSPLLGLRAPFVDQRLLFAWSAVPRYFVRSLVMINLRFSYFFNSDWAVSLAFSASCDSK